MDSLSTGRVARTLARRFLYQCNEFSVFTR